MVEGAGTLDPGGEALPPPLGDADIPELEAIGEDVDVAWRED